MLIYDRSIGHEEDSNEPLSGQEDWISPCSPCSTLLLLGHIIVSFGDICRGQPMATPHHTSFEINELIKQYLV